MDFIVEFHLWIFWIPYEIHLIPYERPGESEESHLNQLFLLISGGFHEIHQISWVTHWISECGFHSGFCIWNPLDFIWNGTWFQDERPEESHFNQLFLLFSGGLHVNTTGFQSEICQISVKSTKFQVKSVGFHEIRRISCVTKDHLPGIIMPMFNSFYSFQNSY